MTDETKRMKVFTYQDIESWEPCYSPGMYLPKGWRGTAIDIFDDKRIPFEDRLWVVARTELVSEKLLRLFAVWCARQVQHLMQDERSKRALDVAEAFANGMATKEELAAAWAAANAAWFDADADADDAESAADATARFAVATTRAAWSAWSAWSAWAAHAAATAAARATTAAASAAITSADARSVAATAAAESTAARAAQESKLREMLIAGIETGDTL